MRVELGKERGGLWINTEIVVIVKEKEVQVVTLQLEKDGSYKYNQITHSYPQANKLFPLSERGAFDWQISLARITYPL